MSCSGSIIYWHVQLFVISSFLCWVINISSIVPSEHSSTSNIVICRIACFKYLKLLGPEGEYRIRGLPPNCPITISVRSDKSADVRRASPASRMIQVCF